MLHLIVSNQLELTLSLQHGHMLTGVNESIIIQYRRTGPVLSGG